MVNSVPRATSPGAGLPEFIRMRMESLNMRPSLTQLAALAGVPKMTLQQNLTGVKEMRVSTAKKLAIALETTTDKLINECNLA